MTDVETTEQIEAGLARQDPPIVEQTAPFPRPAGNAVRRPLDIRNGTRFVVRGCTTPQWWPDRCDLAEGETRGEKRVSQHWEEAQFGSWSMVDVLAADCLDPVFDLQALTDEQVSNAALWAVAREVDHGPASRVNPTLQNSAVAVNTVPASPGDAVAMLLDAMDTGPFQPELWAPYKAIPAFEPAATRPGGRTRWYGLPVSFGTTGNGPLGEDNVLATTPEGVDDDGVFTQAVNTPEAGTAWIYATRTVEYDLAASTPYDPAGLTVAERQNRAMAESVQRGIVRFNPLCIYAALVCLKTENLCGGG